VISCKSLPLRDPERGHNWPIALLNEWRIVGPGLDATVGEVGVKNRASENNKKI
jgi:hypothetical protein